MSTVILIVLAIGVSFYLAWKVIIPKYKEDKTALARAKSEIEAAQLKIDSLDKAKIDLAELGSVVDQMLIALPKDEDTPNLIAELEALAASHQTVIPSIQITNSAGAAAAANNTVEVNFSVNGSFANLSGLITSLEKDIRFMSVQSATLTSSDEQMSLALQLLAYKRIDAAAAANAAGASAGSTVSNAE